MARPARPGAVVARREWTGWSIGALVAVCASAGVFALRHLGTKPLWRDEAASLAGAHRSTVGVLAMLPHHDADSGLYYLFLHVWLGIGHLLPSHLGQGEAWDRGLSVVFAVAAVAAAGWCAGRWQGPVAGLAAAAFLGLNPFWLFYAQEARTFALALLLALVSTAALIGAVEQPSKRRLLTYGVATVLLLWADLFALAFVGAEIAVLVATGRARPLARTWVAVGGCTAPLALWMVAFEPYQISWIPRPTVAGLWGVVLRLGGGGLGLAAAAGLALVALIGGRRRELAWTLAAAAAAPPAGLWIASLIKPVLVDRYVIPSVGALAVLAGGGVAVLWDRRYPVLSAAAAGALAACWLPRDLHLQRQSFKVDDSRAAAQTIIDQAHPGDAIAYTRPGLRLLFDIYLPPGRVADVALAAGQTAERVHDLYPREVTAATLASRLQRARRLWLVSDPADQGWQTVGPLAPLRAEVAASLSPAPPAYFGRTEVVLWSAP